MLIFSSLCATGLWPLKVSGLFDILNSYCEGLIAGRVFSTHCDKHSVDPFSWELQFFSSGKFSVIIVHYFFHFVFSAFSGALIDVMLDLLL